METGVCSAGLSTTQFPAASAGASFQVAISRGKFHGMIWADDAERLVEVIGDGVGVELGDAAFLGPDGAGEIAEMVDRQRHVGSHVSRIGLPLSIVSMSAISLEVLLEPVGDPVEDVGAVWRRRAVPAERGGVSSVERLVDVLVRGSGDLAEMLPGDRRRIGEVLAAGRRRRIRRRSSCRSAQRIGSRLVNAAAGSAASPDRWMG